MMLQYFTELLLYMLYFAVGFAFMFFVFVVVNYINYMPNHQAVTSGAEVAKIMFRILK